MHWICRLNWPVTCRSITTINRNYGRKIPLCMRCALLELTLTCCSVTSQFIKKAAGDYMGNSGNQAASGGGGGGDWSALANLGSHMASHEEQTGGNTNFSQFTDMYEHCSRLSRPSRVVLMLVMQLQQAGLLLAYMSSSCH